MKRSFIWQIFELSLNTDSVPAVAGIPSWCKISYSGETYA
jgi:hypothetical protein